MELPGGCDPPQPVRHRWAIVSSASTICSGTSSDGGSHGRPCPASSRGDNDPHPANPPTLPWHGGLRGLPPVAAVPAGRCQLPRRRRPSPACSAGTAPTPRAPGSPSPGDGTDIPPRRHPRAHRAAVPLCYSWRVWGWRGDTRHPGDASSLETWHPAGCTGVTPGPPAVPAARQCGGPRGSQPGWWRCGGGSPRARAPSQRLPPGLGSPWAQPRDGLV